MSKEIAEQKIKDASAVFSLAKSLYHQLKALEDKKYEATLGHYDFLILVQTSLYSTLVLNLYHLLKDRERHSIITLLNLSTQFLGLDEKIALKMKEELAASEQPIEELKENRDKRIGHFDKKHIAPLNDNTIEHLIALAEKQLKILNLEALKRDHSFNLPLSKGMSDGMEILNAEFLKITGK
jgi:hypothetical protein